MGEIKTKATNASVTEFINSVPDEQKRQDAFVLLEMFERLTGQPAVMWGSSIIGFGQYHYKSDRSTQEGDWPLSAFSPRKQNLTLYVMLHTPTYAELIGRLGKVKTSQGSCLYINKLADVDTNLLEELIARSYADAKAKLAP